MNNSDPWTSSPLVHVDRLVKQIWKPFTKRAEGKNDIRSSFSWVHLQIANPYGLNKLGL